METIKTLKERVTLGGRMVLLESCTNGHYEPDAPHIMEVRTVVEVNSKGFMLRPAQGRPLFIQWPNKDTFQPIDDDQFRINYSKDSHKLYRILPARTN